MGERRAGGESGDLTQGGRGGVFGEVHGDAGGDDDRRPVGIEAGGGQLLQPVLARLEADRHQVQPVGDAVAELDQTMALPCLRAGLVDLEDLEAGGDLRPALGEGVQAGSQDDVLGDAAVDLLDDQVLERDARILAS